MLNWPIYWPGTVSNIKSIFREHLVKQRKRKSRGLPGWTILIQEGARQIIQQAIEAELKALLERYSNVKTLDGRQAVVRNGNLPERAVKRNDQ